MTSLQQPGAKASKFVGTNNLLDPMMKPFQKEEQDAAQEELNRNVNDRMERAMVELQLRHAHGTNFVDDPDRAPTGSGYRQAAAPSSAPPQAQQPQQQNDSVDSDDEWLDDDDMDDPILEAMRQKRMQQLQAQQQKKAQELALGHGEVRTIVQDEFLPECTGSSEWVAVHFYHDEFERCSIMDHHLKLIAPQHTSCKFLRLNAAKAPFFVQKLQLQTLPTLIVFRHGKSVARLVGFEGLESRNNNPDEWPTSSLQRWLAQTGAIKFLPDPDEEEEETNRRSHRVVHRGMVSSQLDF